MVKYFLFANLFFSAIFLTNVCENYAAYTPPQATVQALHPTGLRISIPDEHGITLVAFHVKFNEDFDGLEAGHIAKDILKVRNGQWTYQDRHTQLKRDDIVYYWVHVVYQGLGYNLIDQMHRIVDFYNYDGTLHIDATAQSSQNTCVIKSITHFLKEETSSAEQQACPHQLIFEDNFDELDSAKWNKLNQFGGQPDYEFVVYMTNNVTDTSDGKLRIKPALLSNRFSSDFVSQGTLTLDSCTGDIDKQGCHRQAAGLYILPPVISGRINTKGKFKFLFGRVEIRAKLPRGDWIYPVIILETAENAWEMGQHREIRIASSVGNENLTTSNGENVSGRILVAGGLSGSLSESNADSTNRMALPRRVSNKLWSDDFHIFEIVWKQGVIVVKVDGVEYGEQTVDVSFNTWSYLTLGVAVGGIQEFQDFVTSKDYVKPWRNVEAKAMYNFYQAKNNWLRTWNQETTALQVDYVKVWAL